MNPETVKELKKHLNPGLGWKIAGVCCLALGLTGLVLPVLLIVWVLAAGLCFWRWIAAGRKLDGALEADMIRDYTAALSMFDGELRVETAICSAETTAGWWPMRKSGRSIRMSRRPMFSRPTAP